MINWIKEHTDTGLLISLIIGVIYVVTQLNIASFNDEERKQDISEINKDIAEINKGIRGLRKTMILYGKDNNKLTSDTVDGLVAIPPAIAGTAQPVKDTSSPSNKIIWDDVIWYPDGAVQPDDNVSGYKDLLNQANQNHKISPSQFAHENPKLVRIKGDLATLQKELSDINNEVDELIREALKSE